MGFPRQRSAVKRVIFWLLYVPDRTAISSVMVPTLDGEVMVTVPPGTQPLAVLRVKGKGLPVGDSDNRGDLLLRIQTQVPKTLSDEERLLFKRLRNLETKKV